jgi:formylglycine-generating enzyme required for sulfatase activity
MARYLAALVVVTYSVWMIGGGCSTQVAAWEPCQQPVFSPDGGSFANSVDVQIYCATAGAVIAYTTDGSTPSANNGTVIANGGTVTLTNTTTLTAIAFGTDLADSPIKQAVYTKVDQATAVAQPTFSPNGGSFTDAVAVRVSCSTAGATIRYTIDGTTPSQTNGTIIASGDSVTLTSTTVLAAMAYAAGKTDSPVRMGVYTKADPVGQVAQPTFNPDGGSFSGTVSVQISCATPGAAIRCTTDGSLPSVNNGTVIANGDTVTLDHTAQLSAVAYVEGMSDSLVKEALFTKTEPLAQVATPTFDPDSSSFAGSVAVRVSCATSGATIRYTTDGSTPSDSYGTPMSIGDSVTLTSTTTFSAVAYKNGMEQSGVKQAVYTRLQEVASPAFGAAGGVYYGSVDVPITCATAGATIMYTTDGSAPTTSHGTAITSGNSLHLTSTTTLRALAYKSGLVTSGVTVGTYYVYPPGMTLIPAGDFPMGDPFTVEGDTDERPTHTVHVKQIYMDRYEVSNQQYAQALNWALSQGGLISVTSGVVYQAGTGTTYAYCDTLTSSSYSQLTWNGTAFGVVSGKEAYPVVLVNWYGAVAYANWRSAMQSKTPAYNLATWACNYGSGYRLPTEAEWERAARGGVEGHRFPWTDSDNIDHTRANYYSSTSSFYDLGMPRGFDPVYGVAVSMPYTSPVGTFAANAYGLYDMAGNVWEWCNDWFDGTYYAVSPYDNPTGPTTGSTRVLRGGAWGGTALNLRCAFRSDNLPSYRAMVNGFRLALDVP